jgi:hypothetical protein
LCRFMQSGHCFPVLQSGRRRGPEGPALEFTLNFDARTGLSCMNSFGSLLILIWGTTNREAFGGGHSSTKLVPVSKAFPAEVPGR